MITKIAALTFTLIIFLMLPNLFAQQKDSSDYWSNVFLSGAEYQKNADSTEPFEKEEILQNISISRKKDKIVLITPMIKGVPSDLAENFILWIADLNTGQVKILTKSENEEIGIVHPMWSPDGKWIAFHSFSIGGHSPGTTSQTFLIDTNGVNLTHVLLPLKYKHFSNSAVYWENDHLLIIESDLDKRGFKYDCDTQKIDIIP